MSLCELTVSANTFSKLSSSVVAYVLSWPPVNFTGNEQIEQAMSLAHRLPFVLLTPATSSMEILRDMHDATASPVSDALALVDVSGWQYE